MDQFTTKIKLIFIVFGSSFEPEDLTKLIGVSPTKFWKKGDQIKSNISLRIDNINLPVRNESGWEYSFGFLETLDLQDVLRGFENLFLSKAERIKEFTEKHNLDSTVNVVVEIANAQTPSLNLNKKNISLLYSLGAELDIDTYILEDE